LSDQLRARWGRSLGLEFRMDAAVFQDHLLKLLARRGCCYAIKVPFCHWTGVRAAIAAQQPWAAVQSDISCCETRLTLKSWALDLPLVVLRQHLAHESRRHYQLDLFSPDDGHFEYSAVATNLSLSPPAWWNFMAGRGAQEQTFAELRGEFALDAVPTNHYAANSAWQQLSILAHNLTIGFQLPTDLAGRKTALA
jgi:hypothetical protein